MRLFLALLVSLGSHLSASCLTNVQAVFLNSTASGLTDYCGGTSETQVGTVPHNGPGCRSGNADAAGKFSDSNYYKFPAALDTAMAGTTWWVAEHYMYITGNGAGNGYETILDNNGTPHNFLRMNVSNNALQWNNGVVSTDFGSISVNTCYLVDWVGTATTRKVYINNSLTLSDANVGTWGASATTWVGKHSGATGYYFDGYIDGMVLESGSGSAPTSFPLSYAAASTPTFTSTSTQTPTATPTFTQTPTTTPTFTPTSTTTPSITPTYTRTITPTYTRTITQTWTNTSTVTPTWTNTSTITPTFTVTPSITQTHTNTRTITQTWTNTRTITATFSASPTCTATPTPSAVCTFIGQLSPLATPGTMWTLCVFKPITLTSPNRLCEIHANAITGAGKWQAALYQQTASGPHIVASSIVQAVAITPPFSSASFVTVSITTRVLPAGDYLIAVEMSDTLKLSVNRPGSDKYLSTQWGNFPSLPKGILPNYQSYAIKAYFCSY